MRIFSILYLQILNWAKSRYAQYYLAFLSFVESFILPYPPPDVLLAPMALEQTEKAYKFALITTVFSVLGGIVGYYLGAFLLEAITPLLIKLHYTDKLDTIILLFEQYGVWIIAIAGFSPLPYKVFTIGAGVVSMAFLPFVLMSFVARGARFFLVTFLVRKFGSNCDLWLRKYIDRLGYILIVVIVIGVWYAN